MQKAVLDSDRQPIRADLHLADSRDKPGIVARTVIRPGRTPDGQARMGTPPGAEHRTASGRGYMGGRAHAKSISTQPRAKR